MSTVAPPPSPLALPTAPAGEGLSAEVLARLFEQARPLVESLFAQVSDGVTVQAPDYSLRFANPSALRILGIDSREELPRTGGSKVFARYEMFDASGQPLSADLLPGRQVLTGQSPPERILRFRDRMTGEDAWYRVSAAPVRDAHGQVVYAVNVFRDITEVMRTQEKLSLLAEA
ncbi:PAS domain-containing protein, partial [Archangium sp.]|uniref:PAS domain-containing protein n=1 Tax=Archangium sp. TaxID=1872627 RepID=UPI002EDA868D